MGLFVAACQGWANGPLQALARSLHETVRWFEADLVTRMHADQLDELHDALPLTQAVVEVPCSEMQRIDDLTADFAARYGPMRWPTDAAKKAATILARRALRNRSPLVVVLHDADVLEDRDRMGFTRFVDAWRLRMQADAPPVLLFLVGTQTAFAPQAAPPPPPETPSTPPDAWWRRSPGELTD